MELPAYFSGPCVFIPGALFSPGAADAFFRGRARFILTGADDVSLAPCAILPGACLRRPRTFARYAGARRFSGAVALFLRARLF